MAGTNIFRAAPKPLNIFLLLLFYIIWFVNHNKNS